MSDGWGIGVNVVDPLGSISEECYGCTAVIGNFDGVHLGHRKLLSYASLVSHDIGSMTMALTFEPHPRVVLGNECYGLLLTTADQKKQYIAGNCIDHYIALPCDKNLLRMTCDEFFQYILLGKLSVRAAVVGMDFRFGKGRRGDAETMISLCNKYGIAGHILYDLEIGGSRVSSSRIRADLLSGNVVSAESLLGRRYCTDGRVVFADQCRLIVGVSALMAKVSPKYYYDVSLIISNGHCVDAIACVVGDNMEIVTIDDAFVSEGERVCIEYVRIAGERK